MNESKFSHPFVCPYLEQSIDGDRHDSRLHITARISWTKTTMLAAATSFFARTNISTNYNIGSQTSSSPLPGFGSGSRSSTPGPHASGSSSAASGAALPAPQLTPTFHGKTGEHVVQLNRLTLYSSGSMACSTSNTQSNWQTRERMDFRQAITGNR